MFSIRSVLALLIGVAVSCVIGLNPKEIKYCRKCIADKEKEYIWCADDKRITPYGRSGHCLPSAAYCAYTVVTQRRECAMTCEICTKKGFTWCEKDATHGECVYGSATCSDPKSPMTIRPSRCFKDCETCVDKKHSWCVKEGEESVCEELHLENKAVRHENLMHMVFVFNVEDCPEGFTAIDKKHMCNKSEGPSTEALSKSLVKILRSNVNDIRALLAKKSLPTEA